MAAHLNSKTGFLALIGDRNRKYVSNTRVNAEIAWKIRLLIQRKETTVTTLVNILISQSRIMFELDCSEKELERIADFVSKNAKWPCLFERADGMAYNAKYQRRDGKMITIRLRKIKEVKHGYENVAQQC